MANKIQLESVGFRRSNVVILHGVDITVAPGETVVIVGRSGHGKSTLLDICAGIQKPTQGTVRWDGDSLAAMPRKELMERRKQIGFQFQRSALISNMPVFDNVALPLRYHHETPEPEIRARVREALDECALYNIDRAMPEVLSVSQQRLVALARAIVTRPRTLILDEPIGGMDFVSEEGILNVLTQVQQSLRPAMIIATGTLSVATRLKGRIAVLESGRVRFLDELPPEAVQEMPFVKMIIETMGKRA